ncbi:MAG: hypothetical protein KDN19_15105 [Verrucomicrobiae bacterium]|nr:hypothetical protein [Verrucomicrobiae bacterium]
MASASTGETRAHRLLKAAALRWAQEEGYRAVGLEIGLPNSRYRADVAACRLEKPRPRQRVLGATAVFECKQARPDFLNDSRPEAESVARLAHLNRRREKLERLVGAHYPTLRQGESLFPEYDRADVEAISHQGYRRVITEIRQLEKAVWGRTKFDRLARYRCANLCYLVIRPGILQPAEIPISWGLLAPETTDFDLAENDAPPPRLNLIRKPAWIDAPEAHRLELLHRIAVSGTWRLNREAGLEFDTLHGNGATPEA